MRNMISVRDRAARYLLASRLYALYKSHISPLERQRGHSQDNFITTAHHNFQKQTKPDSRVMILGGPSKHSKKLPLQLMPRLPISAACAGETKQNTQ